MKKKYLALVLGLCTITSLFAQHEKDENDEPKKGFKKENLFTGGSIALSFGYNTFLVGGSPTFGYSLANWADLGIQVNYNYTSYRDIQVFGDKLRQTVYGGGGFLKLYPVRFLFAQAQFEHNFVKQRYIPNDGSGITNVYRTDANSFLIGGGYTTGRYGKGGSPHFYLAVLFDVAGNINSPYVDAHGNAIPIVRAGIQVPLFQGGMMDHRHGDGRKQPRERYY